MTKEEFEAVAGDIDEYEPDALERANCPKAGNAGHRACGLCKHGRPRFTCLGCFEEPFASRSEMRRVKKQVPDCHDD